MTTAPGTSAAAPAAGMAFRRWKDRLFSALTVAAVAIVLAPLAAVLWTVVSRGAAAIDLAFFTELPKPVGEIGGGVANAILGSIVLVVGAVGIAGPVGIPAGVFLASNRAPRLASAVRLAADVLAGVPSIVIGVFVYGLLVLPMRHFSALAGAFALAVVMVPTVVRTTEEVVRMVPEGLAEAAEALGAPGWRTTLQVVLPAAGRGVAAGLLAATARAAGETAPLMFTAFGSPFLDLSPLEPVSALPLVIFNYAVSPYEDWHAKAWASALVLTALVLASNLVARRIIARRDR